MVAGSVDALQARLRLRELAHYYSTASSLPPADFGPRHGSDGKTRPFELTDFQPYSPDLSKDPGLTAIAQLAALRLGCQRSFISLIAESAQHVVAEATRTVSPFNKDDFEEGDGIVLGAQSIPLSFGICTTTIGVFTGTCNHAFGNETAVSDNYICIPDLLAEDVTSRLPALQALPPILRFYMEVPLKSEAGYVIGSICVMDPTVRKAGVRDVEVMLDMAKLVMRHLELTRTREDHHRAVRLLEGMGHFIKGKDSIFDKSKTRLARDDTLPTPTLSSQPSSKELRLNGQMECNNIDSATNLSIGMNAPPGAPAIFNTTETSPVVSFDIPATVSLAQKEPISPANAPESIYDGKAKRGDVGEAQSTTPTLQGVQSIFSRAANLIRESMDLDASCFLELPQDERYRNIQPRKSSLSVNEIAVDGESPFQSSSESSCESAPELQSHDVGELPHTSNTEKSVTLCHRLGFSTPAESSLAGSTVSAAFLTVPAALLSRLSRRYPQGHVFHFDSSGSISETDNEYDTDFTIRERRPRHVRISTKLLQYFPCARSLMFFPMYDSDKQHVHAAYFGYITNPARILQKSELTYVSGFANSITCEVMRIKTEATDKAKSDFISSISHELRSPLHGILASNQLLLESEHLPKQIEFLRMIDTCARTLLDIMNQLLDHAKINHFTKGEESKTSRTKLKRADSENTSLVAQMDLLSVVEETVVSMAVSSSHKFWYSEAEDARAWPHALPDHLENDAGTVPIVLSVMPRKDWTFNSEAGSWRRIIMNLVGNSLKYTRKGHIKVDLSIRDSPRSHDKKMAELRVSDTGQGISADYLKHRLYTPFAQENNLSVGAGLGLSLVQSIVTSLGGKIKITSKVGVGTDVLVTIPLEACGPDPDCGPESNTTQSTISLEGHTFKFLGFGGLPAREEQVAGMSDLEKNALAAVQASIMSVIQSSGQAIQLKDAAKILVIEESLLERELMTYDTVDHCLLVIGVHGRRRATERIKHANYVYLLPPIGPARILQALKTLLTEDTNRTKNRNCTIDLDQDTAPARVIPQTSGREVSKSLPVQKTSLPRTIPQPNVDFTIAPTNPAFFSSEKPMIESSPSIEISNGTTHSRNAILIVDDNAINLRILVTAIARLKLQDVQILTATNGLEALNAYIEAINAGTSVSIVFMDISMPIMDGLVSTREIRDFERIKGMKRTARSTIVAVTGLASAEAQVEIENSGFDVYLRKPVGLKAIREIVAANTERSPVPKGTTVTMTKLEPKDSNAVLQTMGSAKGV